MHSPRRLMVIGALLVAAACVPPASAQDAAPPPLTGPDGVTVTVASAEPPCAAAAAFAGDSTALSRELATLACAPITPRVVRRLRTINDSLAREERALEQRLLDLVTSKARSRSASADLGTSLYLASIGTAVALNAATGAVHDPGGYPKRLDQWTVFHVTAGMALESLGESIDVPVGWRVAAACGGLAAWEHTKGYVDSRDIAAGCAGVIVSAGLRAGWAHLTS